MSYSQFGEDVLIRDLFKRIGTANKWCCEVGAADGEYLSNTLMFREWAWHAVLGEKDEELFMKLSERFGDTSDHLHFGEVFSMDSLLWAAHAPLTIDLCVIDVDGNDYWLWHDMELYRPRVMLIEFNPFETHKGYDPMNPSPRGSTFPIQSARNPMLALADKKGYRLEAETFCNLLFVDNAIDVLI